MKIYGLNKIHELRLLDEKEFKIEKEKHDYFKKFLKSYKYLVCVDESVVFDVPFFNVDFYKRSSNSKDYEFCVEVPPRLKGIDWSEV